jgi:Na+/H+-translocating membrane pyrophosphatase
MSAFFNKIEKIRKQPEHIRLRWAWGMTIAAMVIVVILWMISFSTQRNESVNDEAGGSEVIQELSNQKDAIKDTTDQIKSVIVNQ